MARLTSSFYVSLLMRRVTGTGGFATIARKGAEEAGAVHISLRARTGAIALYAPAPQYLYKEDESGDRVFVRVEKVVDEESLDQFIRAEVRFDSDLWLVELETGSLEPEGLFEVKTP